MPQFNAWEREYKKSKLLTLDDKPQSEVVKFVKFIKSLASVKSIDKMRVLDLGCGTGRNANYFATLGANVTGMEISTTALSVAKKRAGSMGLSVQYVRHDIGSIYPFLDSSFDIVLDITSSNSLDEKSREVYIGEVYRVMKDGGHFFVRALCKDGDDNAKTLLKISPGKEKDTYFMKELGLIERVFSKKDFEEMYGKFFKIELLEKTTHYPKVNGRIYKRNYWIAYMRKGV